MIGMYNIHMHIPTLLKIAAEVVQHLWFQA